MFLGKDARGEKRKATDSSTACDEAKQPRFTENDGEVSFEVLNEVVATVTDPGQMLGPEVSEFRATGKQFHIYKL